MLDATCSETFGLSFIFASSALFFSETADAEDSKRSKGMKSEFSYQSAPFSMETTGLIGPFVWH